MDKKQDSTSPETQLTRREFLGSLGQRMAFIAMGVVAGTGLVDTAEFYDLLPTAKATASEGDYAGV